MDSIEIRRLSPEDVNTHIIEFLEIGSDIPEEYWTEQHFLSERPEKWQLSFAAWARDGLRGYAILSRKDQDTIHLHHFMIGHAWRSQKLGSYMIKEMESRCRAAGARLLTLKVHNRNHRAARFYEYHGFKEASNGLGDAPISRLESGRQIRSTSDSNYKFYHKSL